MSDYNVNELINGLLEQIAQQAKENALLKVQLTLATREVAGEEDSQDGIE